MNTNDAEIVLSILGKNNYERTLSEQDANVHLLLTCAIRDKAEHKIRTRLSMLKSRKATDKYYRVGVLGCMAERLKDKLFEKKIVDVVCGPDAYKDLPRLLAQVEETGQQTANVSLGSLMRYF